MGAATERPPEVILEDGLRKRKDGEKSGSTITASSRVTPLTQVWIPSQRVQNITIWVLLLVTVFFSIAVVVEELQASWYRSPALNKLNSQFYGAESLDRVLKPTGVKTWNESPPSRLMWNVTKGRRSPDGVASNLYLINDNFPGPVVEAQAGEIIHLNVINSLNGESLELHFFDEASNTKRGFWQSSGPPLQKSIIPGGAEQDFQIQIPKDRSGTFAYRAKDPSQAAGGIFGAFIVHGNAAAPDSELSTSSNVSQTVDEERVIIINEWHPFTADRTSQISQPTIAPSILINGVGNYNCSQLDHALKIECTEKVGRSQPNMQFVATKKYRLRIVNAGTASGITITIPGAAMTIIELDGGQRVLPKKATSVGILRPGQTLDALIEWAAGGDDEFIVHAEDDTGDGGVTQSFPVRVSGFLSSKVKPPPHRYRDILRLKPVE